LAAARQAEQERAMALAGNRFGAGGWGSPMGAKPLSFLEIQQQEQLRYLLSVSSLTFFFYVDMFMQPSAAEAMIM